MRLNPIDVNSRHLSRAVLANLRAFAGATAVAACTLLAGCTSDPRTADNAPWSAVGNNGGKADRYAVARSASANAPTHFASGPHVVNSAQ